MKTVCVVLVLAVVVWAAKLPARADEHPLSDSFNNWLEHPAIAYKLQPPADPVADLERRLRTGEIDLASAGPSRYLRAVLDALHVPVSSQIAVFAKDSVQARRIEPQNPRTLFFNDSVVVGWVRGGFIEFAAQDPRQGTVFYMLDPPLFGRPRIARNDGCLACHYNFFTAGVPGMLVKSAGHTTVDHRLATDDRWGGWYVTGQSGSLRHLGNAPLDRVFAIAPPGGTTNWPSLETRVDMAGYLSPHSDIVALMVFDHQMHLMNLLTRIGWEARMAAYQNAAGDGFTVRGPESAGEPVVSMADAAAEVVDYMLFVDEPPLRDAVRGSTDFAATFAARGLRDRKGRSLRDFDLTTRLMKYPCSYMIYSAQFDQLPAAARDAIYRRMWTILSGGDGSPRYSRLPVADRRAVVEILRDTRADLPEYFGQVVR